MLVTAGCRRRASAERPPLIIVAFSRAKESIVKTVLGIVGGSGLYDLPGLTEVEWRSIDSPWGSPSDAILFAEYESLPVCFLPRHGRSHRLSPTPSTTAPTSTLQAAREGHVPARRCASSQPVRPPCNRPKPEKPIGHPRGSRLPALGR